MTPPSAEPDPETQPDDDELEGSSLNAISAAPAGLSEMTKAQLLEYADGLGIQGLTERMTKADILEVIEDAD